MATKVYNQFNYTRRSNKNVLDELDASYFVGCYNNDGVFPRDLTVPDMVMSIQQLIQHHESGRPVPTSQGFFHDVEIEPYMPDFNRMTKIEQIQFMRSNKERVDKYYSDLQKSKEDAENAKAKAKEEDYKRLKELEKTTFSKGEKAPADK